MSEVRALSFHEIRAQHFFSSLVRAKEMESAIAKTDSPLRCVGENRSREIFSSLLHDHYLHDVHLENLRVNFTFF